MNFSFELEREWAQTYVFEREMRGTQSKEENQILLISDEFLKLVIPEGISI